MAVPLPAADWSIGIVPFSSEKEGQSIYLRAPFYVVLTNATDHNLVVWKESCSWGYFNLSFEFTGKDTQVVQVQKYQHRIWHKNFPDGFSVKPGGHFVLPVVFSSINSGADRWTGFEKLSGVMVMKAIYKNPKQYEGGTKSLGEAWTGSVESAPVEVTIVR